MTRRLLAWGAILISMAIARDSGAQSCKRPPCGAGEILDKATNCCKKPLKPPVVPNAPRAPSTAKGPLVFSVRIHIGSKPLNADEPVTGSLEWDPAKKAFTDTDFFGNVGSFLAQSPETYGCLVKVYLDSKSASSEADGVKKTQAIADAIGKLVIASGAAPYQVGVVGMGIADPIAANTTEDGRASNRRVEFEIFGVPEGWDKPQPEQPTAPKGPGTVGTQGSCPAGMLEVAGGTFPMGTPEGTGEDDEHPVHNVTLRTFCVDRTEVSLAAYKECVFAGACKDAGKSVKSATFTDAAVVNFLKSYCNGNIDGHDDYPINCVDWSQAKDYCRWAKKRLPTESEWEYVARGTDGRIYPWGNDAPAANLVNACGEECEAMGKKTSYNFTTMYSGNDGYEGTAPVESYPAGASPFGALNLIGNVYEWVSDWYGNYPTTAVEDPTGPVSGKVRVMRGGGWLNNNPSEVRANYRSNLEPDTRMPNVGFRCVADE